LNKAIQPATLDLALEQARLGYVEHNPESARAHQRAKKVMPGGNTRTVLYNDPFPLRIAHGKHSTVTDVDGHRYTNLLGEYTAGLFGHSHPVIRKAIDSALDQGINLSAHNRHEIHLAEILCQRFASIERVRFTNSGTEANLMAISSAGFVTGKSKVLVFTGGYHGGLLYFGGGGIPINAPFEYVLGTYNDIDATAALIEQHKDDLACVLVEPMMGSAGCIPADKAFLQMLREKTSEADAILIFDEVMTSRLSGGGAQQLLDVIPDMTTLGKYIGGGMSFGAFGGRADIMEIYNPETKPAIPHAGTFNNNNLTMAAGCAAMEKVYTPEVADDLNQRGNQLRQRLNDLISTMQLPLQFTGIGSMMNLHGTNKDIRFIADLQSADDRFKELIFLDLLEHGFYIARRGFIALMLSLTDDDLSRFHQAFQRVLLNRRSVLTG